MPFCAVCGFSLIDSGEQAPLPQDSADPPDFDTRPGEPLRSTLPKWVVECPSCGYCAGDLTRAGSRASEIVGSEKYQSILTDESMPVTARRLLAYSLILEKLHQFADAGWSNLHAAWACDDIGATGSAMHCRADAIDLWKRGKLVGQLFADDMATEFALVTDLYRRTGQFEQATVACSEGLDLEDIPPALEAMLRRQSVLIQQRDTGAHSMRELMHEVG